MRTTYISLLFFTCFTLCFTQPFQRNALRNSCTINGVPLTLPFAGGINGPNHQFFDAEGDGDYDLFVFDQDITLDFYKNDGTRFSPDFRLATAEFIMHLICGFVSV